MTLLVCWAAVDTHGPSSLYIATDSRISWNQQTKYDSSRKVFSFSKWPDVLGYCGDVLFPSITLNQIVSLADSGLLFKEEYTSQQKSQAIIKKLNDLFKKYPAIASGLNENSLTIIHGSRDPITNKFSCRKIKLNKSGKWTGKLATLPLKSDILFAEGTGAGDFLRNYNRYQEGPTRGTSRSVFHCFCDTLDNTKDHTIGGPPQLAALIRKPLSSSFTIGVIHRNQRTYLGAQIDNLVNFNEIVWRNTDFEICDGQTKKRYPTAQKQPDPLRRL